MTFRLSSDALRLAIPALSLTLLLAAVFWLQPRAMSYVGLNLLFNLAVPIALATIAQMIVMAVNDLDLSMGAFVSFVACVTATFLRDAPVIGVLILAGAIATYAGLGVVIYLRNLPSIVVTLGMSFVWGGLAVLLLPAPGGQAPDWVRWLMTVKPPLAPMAIVASIVIALVAHLLVMRSSLGVLMRGIGGNQRSVERAGWSIVGARAAAYGLAGLFAVLAGIALVGLTTSADANIALRYTLLSIAGVILGGGEFIGGRVSPIGAVIGALTLTLAGSFLSFLRISPDWQIGAQGAILIIVLALRLMLNRLEKREKRR
ncbi:ABC transporter permease [Rhizobium johnstonii]|jgi:ribose transport system permease protein|uniref:Inner-membrane translocator n=1 Tax=Rhizobium leguminosarum bv. trifolii (strain WSM1325) TaxID=395491 RepID=C6B473_RHILS|nr:MULTISPECIES: ABC transporter permease [Rhizobium]EJC64222.1 permease component of ribose/xylose/arabinose/galactoside ABC-type transporter [Rhizobium leguminosarum bv. viciae WSM1455]ACS58881.1 inner-membrane translocator [Rhizobium leguminosarum bv. trifolii WSM1325]MBB4508484.1 ribose transport system permease protein [Rhizobium leguminosarum]MBY2908699.1 ABC transporter permease [Rhizobium leguminosarum]MBY2915569.1 ABC transporter permease [Rhizobium leguminosarum]